MGKTCGDCMCLDYKNSQGTVFIKYYCGKMHRYLSDKTNACSEFVERQYAGCYLTSACVEYKGLEDDCYELATLRRFRDEYVAKLDNGKELINKYYETAPRIVTLINKSEIKDEIYGKMYDYILLCVGKINAKDYQTALELYISMVDNLSNKFLSDN